VNAALLKEIVGTIYILEETNDTFLPLFLFLNN